MMSGLHLDSEDARHTDRRGRHQAQLMTEGALVLGDQCAVAAAACRLLQLPQGVDVLPPDDEDGQVLVHQADVVGPVVELQGGELSLTAPGEVLALEPLPPTRRQAAKEVCAGLLHLDVVSLAAEEDDHHHLAAPAIAGAAEVYLTVIDTHQHTVRKAHSLPKRLGHSSKCHGILPFVPFGFAGQLTRTALLTVTFAGSLSW
mmetsp:Transcript_24817/g.61358  ORF Transcript_24817/g.61358 Transcript_24817/m.61358 type:complete len:202 (-) Transcript_24817:1738-2343(-)